MPLEIDWQLDGPEFEIYRKACGQEKYPYTVNGAPALLLRYRKSSAQQVKLVIKAISPSTLDGLQFEIENQYGRRVAVTRDTWIEAGATLEQVGNLAVVTLSVSSLLRRTACLVNCNLFTAMAVTKTDKAVTPIALHIIQQKAIVLLPGVLATEVHIDGEKCWPQPSSTAKRLEKLACDSDGAPLRQPSLLRVIQGLTDDGLYQIGAWTKHLNVPYPVLLRGKTRLWHVHLQEYPYDWRPRLELMVDVLIGAKGEVPCKDLVPRPSWAKPPCLWSIIKGLQAISPFFADKVAIAGHSTGGVIVNGLLRRPEARHLIAKAFFIATPFHGAIKPYYALLRGTMLLGAVESLVLPSASFKALGCNLPVLYYLAPSPQYTAKIARINDREYSRRSLSADAVTELLMDLIFRLRKEGDPFLADNAQSWNRQLQRAADAYQKACTEPIELPEGRCKVFYSSFREKGKPQTVGPIIFNPGENVSFQMVDGDGTVPMESLKGSFEQESLKRIDGDLDHTGIMASEQMWDTIRDDMLEVRIGDSHYLPGTPIAPRRPAHQPSAEDLRGIAGNEDAFEERLSLLAWQNPRISPSYGTF